MIKAALVTGVGVLAFFGLFAYNHKRKIERIPREKMLLTLKNLRSQLFFTLVDVSSFVKENASRIPPDQLKQYVLG